MWHELYLEQIRLGCQRALDYTAGLEYQDLVEDQRTYDAVLYNLGQIGLAAQKVSPEVRKQYPDLDWPKLLALTGVVHQLHFGIQDEIIWDLVKNKLPEWLLGLAIKPEPAS